MTSIYPELQCGRISITQLIDYITVNCKIHYLSSNKDISSYSVNYFDI
jgi:hypothetical protein